MLTNCTTPPHKGYCYCGRIIGGGRNRARTDDPLLVRPLRGLGRLIPGVSARSFSFGGGAVPRNLPRVPPRIAGATYSGKFMRRSRSWKRGSERKSSNGGSTFSLYSQLAWFEWACSSLSSARSFSPQPAWIKAILYNLSPSEALRLGPPRLRPGCARKPASNLPSTSIASRFLPAFA